MILAGERDGKLHKGKTILDATSGNTGIAYAMIGAARGYKVTLCLPKNASAERKRILKIYGAEIIETDPMGGTDAAQIVAKELAAAEPEKYFYPRPIQQPGKLDGTLQLDRAGDLESNKRQDYAFRRRSRNDRNFCRTTRRLKEYNRKFRRFRCSLIRRFTV
jgi:cysteine synthase B